MAIYTTYTGFTTFRGHNFIGLCVWNLIIYTYLLSRRKLKHIYTRHQWSMYFYFFLFSFLVVCNWKNFNYKEIKSNHHRYKTHIDSQQGGVPTQVHAWRLGDEGGVGGVGPGRMKMWSGLGHMNATKWTFLSKIPSFEIEILILIHLDSNP